jgi:hypothetical protein
MANRLPPVDPQLVEWLEAKWPNRVPDIDEADREIWAAVGRQEVIAYIKGIANKTVKENLGYANR